MAPKKKPELPLGIPAADLLKGAVQRLMSSQDGRDFAWWVLMDLGYLLSQSDVGEGQASARNAGRRDVALDLLQYLRDNCPADYRLMWSERVGISNANGTTP